MKVKAATSKRRSIFCDCWWSLLISHKSYMLLLLVPLFRLFYLSGLDC